MGGQWSRFPAEVLRWVEPKPQLHSSGILKAEQNKLGVLAKGERCAQPHL